MDHADTAQLAAVLGALGAAFVLLARTRSMLLAGFALLACAEAGLIWSLSGDGGTNLTVGPVKILATGAGLIVLILGTAALLGASVQHWRRVRDLRAMGLGHGFSITFIVALSLAAVGGFALTSLVMAL